MLSQVSADIHSENFLIYGNQETETLEEITIKTRNLELSALAWGSSDLPAVIALHGWLDNAASFIPIAEHLENLRLIALDMPGHGKSQHRAGVNAYHFIDYATDVILAADALGLENFSLLGHSLGAGVAGVICSVIPERINRLAMVEGLAPVTGPPERFVDQLRSHVDRATQARVPPRTYKNLDDAAKARQQAGLMSLASARLIVRRNLIESEDGFTWRTDRFLRQPSPVYLVEEHVTRYLESIQCESILIRSKDGIILNWEALRGREKYLDRLTVIDIEGGHHCHMDLPEIVAHYVLPFLSG
ncbi:MAG: alpha/beta hydrolase [Acidiferrobacterales bacterium]|nr:alpha/beta hydrolase [Acidiferrobacterales bacterium]